MRKAKLQPRVKLKVTVEVEYWADPDGYGTDDPDKMAEIDKFAYEDDASVFLDVMQSNDSMITVEPCDE